MTQETHIFYSPHADDETLSMGAAILDKVRQGARVIVILLTDGTADLTNQCLNGEIYCQWHDRFHDPDQEQYLHGVLTSAQFAEARREEFRRTLELMDLSPDDKCSHDYRDGELPKQSVREIALNIEKDKTLPSPKYHHTMTDIIEWHADHIASGGALRALYEEGLINQPYWYVKRSMWEKTGDHPVENLTLQNEDDREIIRRIFREVYSCWDPRAGRYGIGYHSVPESFKTLIQDFSCRYHR